MKLSLIVPVYNSEDFIGRCIQSCVNQDIQEEIYEIIIVDDGSTDKSGEIIKEYANAHSNIKYITKQNEGVSSARNDGIQIALGEYILFVDSDDTIKENSLKSVIDKLVVYNPDLLIMNSVLNNRDNIRVYPFPQISGKEFFSGIELYQLKYIRGSVCGVAFKNQFLKDYKLSFSRTIKNSEDTFFIACSFLYTRSIVYHNIDFYKINQRLESASRSWTYLKVKQMLSNLQEIEKYINQNELSFEQVAVLRITAYIFISNSLYYFFETHEYRNYHEIKSKIKKSRLYPVQNYISDQFKFKIYLLNLSIDLFCVPYLFRQIIKDLNRSFLNYNRKIAQINV